jgi:hypothetical protein
MRWRWHTSWFLAFTLLAVLGTGAAAQGPAYGPPGGAPPIIEPGRAIGSLTLDTSLGEFYWALGTPAPQLNGPGPEYRATVAVAVWADASTVVLYREGEQTPAALATFDPGYATRKQIGVGAEEGKITGAYGDPSAVIQLPARPKFLIYDALGVAFQIAYDMTTGKYGTVQRVFVFRSGQAKDIWRTP